MYKAIIFDWDGTLVDTCGLILNAHNHVREHYNLEKWTMEDFLGRASKSAREYYPEVYGDQAEEAQVILYDFVEEHHLNFLKPINGTKEILDQLAALGVPLGIVSNKRHPTLHKEIEYLGWGNYFKVVIGAGFADKDKPSPEPLNLALQSIDTKLGTSEVLYIGDTETDLMTAQNAKMDIAFIPENPREDLIERYSPKFTGHNIEILLQPIINKIQAEPTFKQNKAC